MKLKDYVGALRKGWWIVAICALLGLAGGFIYTRQATPQYVSSVTWFVSTPSGDGTSPLAADQFATRRITSYVGLLDSDLTARAVVDTTGVSLTTSQVVSRVTGDADLNTVLLRANVVDSDPDRSLLIAQGLADKFGGIVNQVDPIGPGQVELRVISGPTLNPVPVSPRTTANLVIGLAIGLSVGVAVALARVLFDTTIRQVTTLRILTGAPVLGSVPFDRGAKKSPLIAPDQTRSVRAEAFRKLRTNLKFVDVARPAHILVVTSALASEGKSSTAVNLALSFAEAGRRTLLIEADLRRPRVSDLLSIERSVGLTNLLAGQVDVGDVIQLWGSSGLSVLPSGSIPPNAAELLGSEAMSLLIRALRKRYDMIIIDTPPLLPVTDAAVTIAHADGAVLVARFGRVTRNQVLAAVRAIKAVDGRLLGCILNMTPRRGEDVYEAYEYEYESATGDGSTIRPITDTEFGPRRRRNRGATSF